MEVAVIAVWLVVMVPLHVTALQDSTCLLMAKTVKASILFLPTHPTANNSCVVIVDIDECATGLAGCSHSCTNIIGSFRCTCPAETFLESDGRTCEGCSIDNGGCQQVCVTAPGDQSFHCLCHGNYELTNGKKCRAKGPQPYLLFANDDDIRQMNFDGTGYKSLQTKLNRAFAMDIHYQRGKVYFSSQSAFSDFADLYELDLATNNAHQILSDSNFVDDPAHIAIDWVNDKLYWTDVNSVMRVDLDGSNPKELIRAGRPYGIAVDPYLG